MSPRGTDVSGTFTVLHTNDFHGRYYPIDLTPADPLSQTADPGWTPRLFERGGRIGGFAHQATVVERIRRQRGAGSVLLVHGGDTFSDDLLGNLTRGEAVIRLMNDLGYEFLALGNHDFDYGVERTRELQELARFPLRGANVLVEGTGEPFLGDPTRVVNKGGLRVGLLALGYPNTEWTASPDNIRGLRFTGGVEAARKYLPDLRERSDMVVVISHQGTVLDSLLAREVPGIDLIIGAHSHDWLAPPKRVGNTWIVQALSNGTLLGELTVEVRQGRVVGVRQQVHPLWNDTVEPDPRVLALIDSLRAPHRAQLEEVIASAAQPIARDYKTESPFDVLVGEILRSHTGAEVALLPGVGYGVTLREGPVQREALYTLLPHPAKLATLEMTGAQIRSVLEQSATNLNPEQPEDIVGGLVQTAGMQWTADLSRPPGTRVRDITIDHSPLEPARWYRVATHTGMLAGIHRYQAVSQGRNIQRTDYEVREIVETAFRQMGTVHPPESGRVRLTREH